MRFAYIDSQGNEVTIPSVDALALRIELGAIGPETDLYDAQGDRWGPAHSHEIFHSLSRDVAGDDFLVPGPLAPPSEAPQASEEAAADEVEMPAPPPRSPVEGTFGLTLAPADHVEGAAPGVESGRVKPSLDTGPSDLGPDVDEDPLAPPESLFDFGMVDPEPRMAERPDAGEDDLRFQGSMDALDEAALGDESEAGEAAFGAGALDLEPPMSDFDPSSPPAWMEQDGPGSFGDDEGSLMDFSPDAQEDRAEEGGGWGSDGSLPATGTSAASQPRSAPSDPRRPPPRRPVRRTRSMKPLALLLLAGLAGAGGWYGWNALAQRPGAEPPRPAVVIPPIPAELEGPMRELAGGALADMYRRVEARAFPSQEPQAPSEEWLAGVYLGQASSFGEVAAFWSAVAGFAERLRTEEIQAFHEAYTSLAGATEYDEGTRALLIERADSGFMATRDDRLQVYDRLDDVAVAALALHDFLLTHEQDIVYTPARAFAGNPIEEVVPATPEIGDQMWDLVEDITNALDALGTLDRVTLERLSTVLLERVREIGIR